MRIPFDLKEFLIEPTEKISVEIANKIYKYHIIPMLNIRKKLGFPIFPSKRSSYRSVQWELNHFRKGGSQHCFKKKGATDWTCSEFKANKNLLLSELIKHSPYTRIAVYNTFIHCDYKEESGDRHLFDTVKDADGNTVWKFNKKI